MTITPEMIAQLSATSVPIVAFHDGAGRRTLTISTDGNVVFGDGITPEIASQIFWRAVEATYPKTELAHLFKKNAALRERLEKAKGVLLPFADEAAGADHFGLSASQSWPVAVDRLYAARAFLQKEEL